MRLENLIVELLPRRRVRLSINYGATLAIVGCAFLIRLGLRDLLGGYPVLLFIPAVFIAALVFDRGSGVLATVASALLAAYFFIPGEASFAIDVRQLVPLGLFVVIGVATAAVTETLRKTVAALAEAERQTTLLFEELQHRTKNDIQMIASVLRLQARNEADPAVRAALGAAIGRVDVVAKAQARFRSGSDGETVEIRSYLTALCGDLGDLLRGVRPITIEVRAEPREVPHARAVAIGLIVNELVTNALKYAFPGDRSGAIKVALRPEGDALVLSVSDDGVGCPAEAPDGLGSKLVRSLAAQLNGILARGARPQGCEVTARLPRT